MPLLPLLLMMACALQPQAPPPPPPDASEALVVPAPASWPAEAAALRVIEAAVGGPTLRVALDPGHGVGSNSGNDSCLCIEEQDHNLRVARHLGASLEAGGHSVWHSRQDNRGPDYSARIDQAQGWGAQALISLHSDARGAPSPGEPCGWNDANPGFSVLWSDEGDAALVAARIALARALAARLGEAGFLPYDGYQYSGIYEGDPDHPGVFLDRHEPRRRVRMLRRPTMPSVIIETHNALDRREEPRWQEPATLEAFDAAVLAALADWAGS
jgi:N-acetylmuramoyl-L-alanine amidase